jgi:peptide/nickel transport system substrate-binding protein
METQRGVSRRAFIGQAALGLAGVSLLAACGQSAPAAKPAEAPKPTEAAKPATTAPAAGAATAPAAAKPADAAKPAAGATTAPAAAAKPADAAKPAAKPDAPLGSQLIGKLEGPTVQPDATRPAKLGEAPMLAELVKAGKLPPVEQRVPDEPLVIKPLESIGKYGGTWRRAFTGPGDNENGNRINSSDKMIFWDYTGTKLMPSVAKKWEVSDGGRTTTLFFRKGHKWSDGQPFGADDVVFWFEEMYGNKELTPTGSFEMSINGKPGTVKKVDDQTVQFVFPDPYPGFIDILCGATYVGTSQSNGAALLRGPIAPKHYLTKFLPKFAGQDQVDKQAKDAGFDNWKTYFTTFAADWRRNTDLPVLMPWRMTSPINTPNWVIERNPYYYAVDTEGNQLPYIDKIQFTLGENLEVVNLRAIAGEYDWQERHTGLDKLPVFLENQQKGNYSIHLDPAANGGDAVLQTNQSFVADAEIGKWLRNRDFRHALSLGIDRDQLNETFWLGIGTPGSVAPADDSLYSPGPEYRKKWATLDVAQANQLLDKIGLDKKDGEGMRLRTDNGQRLRIEVATAAGQFISFTRIGEMMAQHLKKIGIDLNVVEQERTLVERRRDGNELQTVLWQNDGSEMIYSYPPHALPVRPDVWLGPEIGRWYASGGSQGTKPEDPQMVKVLEMFRGAFALPDAERVNTAKEIWKLLVEETYSIGTVGLSPAVMGVRIVKNTMGNVPGRQMNAMHCRTPCSSHPPTIYFKS